MPRLWLLLIFSSLWGCAPEKISITTVQKGITDSDYDRILSRWTRHKKAYKLLASKIFATATYKSLEYRQAYIKKAASIYSLNYGEIGKWTQRERAEHQKYHLFALAVFTGEPEWNELDNKKSMWRVSLSNDQGEKVYPLRIDSVRDTEKRVSDFFSYYDNTFQKLYLIKFPRMANGKALIDKDTKFFVLRVASVEAQVDLIWNLN